MLRADETTCAPYAVLLVLLAGCANHAATADLARTRPARGVSEASVRAHLEFLASDALNGRASGTRDEQIAAEYVGAQFRRLGVQAGRHRRQLRADGRNGARATATGKPSIAIGERRKWTYGKEFVAGLRRRRRRSRVRSSACSGSGGGGPRGAVVFLAEENQELAGPGGAGGRRERSWCGGT